MGTRLLRLLLASSLMTGCSGCLGGDYASALRRDGAPFDPEPRPETNNYFPPHHYALRTGAVSVITARVIHPEIEGSSSFDASALRSDDERIVRVAPTGGAFVVWGVAPGETQLRATGGDYEGALRVVVLP